MLIFARIVITNSLKVSSLKFDERPTPGLSFNGLSSERKFENQFRTQLSVTRENVFSCFCNIFVIRKLPHYMQNMHFQFINFKRVRSWIKSGCTPFHY